MERLLFYALLAAKARNFCGPMTKGYLQGSLSIDRSAPEGMCGAMLTAEITS
jgi:hypothetical protein